MSDLFIECFAEKLILLEQKKGAAVSYRLMSPITMSFYDCLSIQKAAKQIADFIGLTGFTFVITVSKLKKNIGGKIDLCNNGEAVFIEIDEETLKFPDVVGAILCHEICHKWLQINGIKSSTERDNEILTDIATVFLGFGKIMLNGCKSIYSRNETIPNGTRTITQT